MEEESEDLVDLSLISDVDSSPEPSPSKTEGEKLEGSKKGKNETPTASPFGFSYEEITKMMDFWKHNSQKVSSLERKVSEFEGKLCQVTKEKEKILNEYNYLKEEHASEKKLFENKIMEMTREKGDNHEIQETLASKLEKSEANVKKLFNQNEKLSARLKAYQKKNARLENQKESTPNVKQIEEKVEDLELQKIVAEKNCVKMREKILDLKEELRVEKEERKMKGEICSCSWRSKYEILCEKVKKFSEQKEFLQAKCNEFRLKVNTKERLLSDFQKRLRDLRKENEKKISALTSEASAKTERLLVIESSFSDLEQSVQYEKEEVTLLKRENSRLSSLRIDLENEARLSTEMIRNKELEKLQKENELETLRSQLKKEKSKSIRGKVIKSVGNIKKVGNSFIDGCKKFITGIIMFFTLMWSAVVLAFTAVISAVLGIVLYPFGLWKRVMKSFSKVLERFFPDIIGHSIKRKKKIHFS